MEKNKGSVVWFDDKKGFGFLSREGLKDLFVHYSNIQTQGFKTLKAGQTVEFEIGQNKNGDQAINVVVVVVE